MDFDLVTSRLGTKASATVRQGEIYIPTIAEGQTRLFDPRMSLDHWKKWLQGRKSRQQSLDQQLEIWVSQLYSARSAFAEFKALGYWSVLDCEIWPSRFHYGSVQYRVKAELLQKVARLGVDINLTVNVSSQV
jgi:hypothetical protein